MWYSSKPKPKAQVAEPEATPLKTLLGENSPQVIVGSKQEQKSVSKAIKNFEQVYFIPLHY